MWRSPTDAGAGRGHSLSQVALAVQARCVSVSFRAEGKEGTTLIIQYVPERRVGTLIRARQLDESIQG